MDNASIIGIDISKRCFQLHGATASGAPVMRKRLPRGKVREFLGSQSPCLVVMEACGGAHYWGREIQQFGHEVRLIAPVYVKPFVKRRQKNDANDAAAIIEAAQRPTMRFVAVKTEQARANSMLFRTRGLLVQQRTQTVNALRGHLAEFGLVAARGVANVKQLWQAFAQCADTLPELVVRNAGLLFDRVAELTAQIDAVDSSSTVSSEVQKPISCKIMRLCIDQVGIALKCSGKFWPESPRNIPLFTGLPAITFVKCVVSMMETPHVRPRQESRHLSIPSDRRKPPRRKTRQANHHRYPRPTRQTHRLRRL